ncbi:MAG TPA: radical SAM protein [bacterium]|nr:radical SAM protein [bacterium]HPQ66574.1 radical SAM protein [bacterium]
MTLGKEIRAAAGLTRARLLRRRVPFFVQLMPTERCNLRCRYCYAEFGHRVREDFPRDRILSVIDGLARLGTKVIMVAGGEPTLYEGLGEMIERISGHGIECSVNTNGLLVPRRLAELERADMLSISLDGPPEIHEHYRGKGTYERVLAAAESARARGLRVQFQFTLTREPIRAFRHVHEIAERMGCFIGINFLRPQERIDGTRVEAEEAGDEEIREFIGWLASERPATVPYPGYLFSYVLRWPYGYGRHLIRDRAELNGFKPIVCRSGNYLVAIDNVGDIYPCTKLFYSEPLGNCLDGGIERAWANLAPVRCQACLDLGCNLMNGFLGLHPRSLIGLSSAWLRTRHR